MMSRSNSTSKNQVSEILSQLDENTTEEVEYIVVKAFASVSALDLNLSIGETIIVTESDFNDYWYGRNNEGKCGMFPASCVAEKNSERAKSATELCKLKVPIRPPRPKISSPSNYLNLKTPDPKETQLSNNTISQTSSPVNGKPGDLSKKPSPRVERSKTSIVKQESSKSNLLSIPKRLKFSKRKSGQNDQII